MMTERRIPLARRGWPAAALLLALAGCTADMGGDGELQPTPAREPIAESLSVPLYPELGGPVLAAEARRTDSGAVLLEWELDAPGEVEIYRASAEAQTALPAQVWAPEPSSWGELLATLPSDRAGRYVDASGALQRDRERYLLRVVDEASETVLGSPWLLAAEPIAWRASTTPRDDTWADRDMNGVGTHEVATAALNARGDDPNDILFVLLEGDLLALTYETQDFGGTTLIEAYVKSGPHAGERAWVAGEYLTHATLEVCGASAVNVRSGATLATVEGVASAGAPAYVLSGTIRNTGEHRYVEVAAGGVRGFVTTEYLCARGTGGGTGGGSYDAALGQALGDDAYASRLGYSIGRCYQYVWETLRYVLGAYRGTNIDSTSVPPTSAYQFADWAQANPATLRSQFSLEEIDSWGTDAPVGSVIVWDPSQCGAHPVHGHIEIVSSPGYACSDYCATVRTCSSKPRVFQPVR